MHQFLLYIGIYNVAGSLLLMLFNSEKVADSILRKYTEIISEPYLHGPFGRLWLWWAASSNLCLGMIMIIASRWNEHVQREVILIAIGTYLIMYFVMIIGGKKPKYGRGLIVTHVLWVLQISWGIWSLID